VTDVPDEELAEAKRQLAANSVNPMDLKKRLAFELVSQFHSAEAACEADIYFSKVFQKREMPKKIPERAVSFEALKARLPAQPIVYPPSDSTPLNIVDVLWTAEVVKSRSEAKRLLLQGAIEVDGERVTSDTVSIRNGSIIKLGKRRFVRLVDADRKRGG